MTLPDADWQRRPGLAELYDSLGVAQGQARIVGGAVRDTLLGLPVADVDLATRHGPEDVLDLLRRASIRAVPTGLAHGTITAVLETGPVEVTTLRRDVATDGRHATVTFTDDWREDAARRDFTMNALYADPLTGEIFDYFGGLADLAARRVRFIGDPLQRIAEDHLRILRFFRFLARFGDAPDAEGLAACVVRSKDLMALSRERIADELLKLLIARHAPRVVRLMVDRGIFLPVLPEIVATGVDRLDALATHEDATGIVPDAIRRLAALLPANPEVGDSIGARLKLSKLQRRRLITAVSPAPAGSPEALAFRLGTEGAVDVLLLAGNADAAKNIEDWPVPRMPLTGGALVERGLSKGPEVARALHAIEDQWIEEGFPDEARVSIIADEIVAQALRSIIN